jgi:hypothetical protein
MNTRTTLDEQRMRRYMLAHCSRLDSVAFEEAAYLVTAPVNQGTPWCDTCSDRHDTCDPHSLTYV